MINETRGNLILNNAICKTVDIDGLNKVNLIQSPSSQNPVRHPRSDSAKSCHP